jgi:hypothetical protein
MQIIYRMTGLAFGKIWLSVVFISFLLYLSSKLRESIHPILAGWFLILFLLTPEMYAYTMMILTDYSNAVFFCISIILFYEYVKKENIRILVLSSVFMGFATWCRSETIILALFGSILLLFLTKKTARAKTVKRALIFAVIPLIMFIAWNHIYVNLYLRNVPSNQINPNLFQLSHMFRIIHQITTKLIFNINLYGYSNYMFVGFTAINLIVYRDLSGLEMLIWILLLCTGFILIAHVFEAASVQFTIKRSLFKLFPLTYFYLSQTRLMNVVSKKMCRLEGVT